MNTIYNRFRYKLTFVLLILSCSCKKEDVVKLPPLVYLTGAVNASVNFTPSDAVIDKTNGTATFLLGIGRSGLQNASAFSVKVDVDTADLPANTMGLKPSQYSLWVDGSDSGASLPKAIEVKAGQTSAAIHLTVSADAFIDNPGKQLAIRIDISDPSKYSINEALSKQMIILNVDNFIGAYTDVTNAYLLNPGGDVPFKHGDWGGRYGILSDWVVNASVKNQGGYGGYDADPVDGGPFLSMETWGAPLIPEGKIYQTITLPRGKYLFDADVRSGQIYPVTKAFIVVTGQNELPNTGDIDQALSYTNIDVGNLQNNKLYFEIAQDSMQVSIGFIANLDQGFQYFRVSGVKLNRQVNVFQ